MAYTKDERPCNSDQLRRIHVLCFNDAFRIENVYKCIQWPANLNNDRDAILKYKTQY
jgi:hypothetical protein